MTVTQALSRIHRRLTDLEHKQARLGQHPIVGGPLTPMQRRTEIVCRLDHLLAGQPDVTLIEQAAAHLVALLMAADEAELARVDTGEAA